MEPTTDRVTFDVDQAFCISLKEREYKRALFQQTFAPLISNPIKFFITQRCRDPVQGCYESHQALAQRALAEEWERILIFVDDAKPYRFRSSQIRWVNRFIRANQFQPSHPGRAMGSTWLTWFPFLARGRVVVLHAYIISREGCRVLAETPYSGAPVEVMFKQQIKQHCMHLMFFHQHGAAVAGCNVLSVAIDEDEWWQRNFMTPQGSMLKNISRTMSRLRF
ncbi:hypothetical protein PS838_04182 [Pseudomonas fluorescens]|nr:hypothetical protein PS838_04182 [Pseudomonas fluorescens]